MPRELSCHGSPTVHALVDPREGPEGDEGSYLHHCIAKRLIDEYGAIPPDGGLPDPVLSPTFKTPKHSMWIVDWCVRRVRDTIPADWALFVELELVHDFDRWTLSGHQDVFAISPDGTLFKGKDWKTGYVGVDPAGENDQVLSYVVSDKLEWPSLLGGDFEICQPRLSEGGDHPRVSVVRFSSGAELEACIESLDRRKCAALDDPYSLLSGPQCKWCVGLSCPCLQALLNEMKLSLTPEILARIKRTPDDALLGDLQVAIRTLTKPMEDLKTMLHERIKLNGSVTAGDGTRITVEEQNGPVKVIDPVNVLRTLLELMPADSLAPALSYPKGRIVDAIAGALDVHKGGADAVTGESVYQARLAPFVEPTTKKILKYL